MGAPVICFFTSLRTSGDVARIYTPPAPETAIIRDFINAGYAPIVNSTYPAKECVAKAICMRTSVDEFTVYDGGEAFCLVYWNEIADNQLAFALGHFNRFIDTRQLVPNGRRTRLSEKIYPVEQQKTLGGSTFETCEMLPDGRVLVARVEGGDRADEVNRLIAETAEILDEMGDSIKAI